MSKFVCFLFERRLKAQAFSLGSRYGWRLFCAGLFLQILPMGNPAHATAGRSTNIALTRDGRTLINVNRDANSVTAFAVRGGGLVKAAEIPVGQKPHCVAVRQNAEAYVTNSASGTVSVIRLNSAKKYKVIREIPVGTEPRGCALTPSGSLLYVANYTQSSVSVIDTRSKQVVATVPLPVIAGNPPPNPMAIAVTDNGNRRDRDETVFVTQFLAELRPGGPGEAFDDGKQGVVFAFPVSNPGAISRVILSPLPDSGFAADRTNFCKKLNPTAANDTFCPDPNATTPSAAITNDPQGVFPNQLHAALVRGNRLYLPNIGAQPEPPEKFNVNIQSLVHVVDAGTLSERADLHVNLNNQIKTEIQPPNAQGSLARLFANDIVAIDANPNGNDFLIVSRGGNVVLRASGGGDSPLNIGAPNSVVRFQTGNLPTGVAMHRNGRLAFVNNHVNCSVSILDLDNNTVLARDVESCTLPVPGSHEDNVLKGELAFFTALGVPDNGLVGLPIRSIDPLQFRGKQSDNGWSSCGSCHPAGLADGVTWIFGAGPRQTIPLDGQYSKINPAHDVRILNWSAIRSSNTDFNNNSRGVQGGCGFASDNFDPSNTCLAQGGGSPTPVPANPAIFDHGISQGASEALDLQTLWEETVRPLNQPTSDPNAVNAGRSVFANNCASCHGGAKWTKSQVLYLDNPTLDRAFTAGGTPRDPGLTFTANQVVAYADKKVDSGTLRFLENIGTFNAANPIEVRDGNGAVSLGKDGFNVPSLLGVNSNAPYFHNGSAQTLEAVFAQHALGGSTIESTLSAGDRVNLLAFLRSLDGRTALFESDADIFKDPDPPRSLP